MIRFKIDNRETSAEENTYVLAAARTLGIHIPTMCHLESLEPFATCMLCIVKDRNTGKLFPSCSVRPEEGMDIITNDTEVREARKTALELLLSDHVGDCEAPCQISCPAHMNIPLMNRLLASGKFDAALEVVKRDIALPSILGRICPAPCEGACRRKPIDQAVSVCLLKRYAGDFGKIKVKLEKPSGRRVAVIGSGPAGLSAAWYMQLRGIACEIFDEGTAPGGALRYRVPKKDLPEEVLDREITTILDTGVIIHSGYRVDKEDFTEICKKFDAVVIATGDFTEDQQNWEVDFTEKGFAADKKNYTTNLPGIFVAGNAMRSQKMAVRASGQGKEAALSVHQYLSGEEIQGEPRIFNSRFGKLMEQEYQYYLLDSLPGERIEPNAGNNSGFDQEEVMKEAARCMHCDCRKIDNCRLRDYSEEYGADQRHYWNNERKPVTKSLQHELVVYEPRKCIKCSLCVRLTEKYREKIGLSFIGRGFDVEIGVPFNEELRIALTDSAREAAEVCPTGALAFKNQVNEK
jgi:NADPH-dependent glutamate synthase beta subunit-like oxidoreductase